MASTSFALISELSEAGRATPSSGAAMRAMAEAGIAEEASSRRCARAATSVR